MSLDIALRVGLYLVMSHIELVANAEVVEQHACGYFKKYLVEPAVHFRGCSL